MTAIGGSLLSRGLQQGSLQRHQFLRIFGSHHGLGMLGSFVHRGLGNLHVQFDQLFHAFKSLLAQVKQGGDVGFVGGHQLFSGQHVDLRQG